MILVTGATGKIGGEVVKLLVAAKAPARALVRNPGKAKGLSGIEVVKGDLDDAASVAAAVAGVDAVMLVTGANPVQETTVIEAAKAAGVKHVVLISVLGASPDAKVQLGRNHAVAEAALRSSGLGWTILQPGMFTQNYLGYAGLIRGQGKFFAAMGDGKTAPIDVRDIAEVAVKALLEPGHEGKVYVLTGGEAVSQAEIAAKLSAEIGKPVEYVNVPPSAAREGMIRAGMPSFIADDLVLFHQGIAAGEAAFVFGDVEKVLGRKPKSVDDFARDYAAAFK